MEKNSPIKDLFPDPCNECIKFKSQLKNLEKPLEDTDEYLEYKKILSEISIEYSNHIKDKHSDSNLYIERIEEAVQKLI